MYLLKELVVLEQKNKNKITQNMVHSVSSENQSKGLGNFFSLFHFFIWESSWKNSVGSPLPVSLAQSSHQDKHHYPNGIN